MRKFVRTYSPFLVYFVCVALAYFLCFYLFPKYNAALAYLGFLIIYTYIDIGGFILGFFMGKIIVKRSIDISFLLCLIYALISFGLMLLTGSLKYVFMIICIVTLRLHFQSSLNHQVIEIVCLFQLGHLYLFLLEKLQNTSMINLILDVQNWIIETLLCIK